MPSTTVSFWTGFRGLGVGGTVLQPLWPVLVCVAEEERSRPKVPATWDAPGPSSLFFNIYIKLLREVINVVCGVISMLMIPSYISPPLAGQEMLQWCQLAKHPCWSSAWRLQGSGWGGTSFDSNLARRNDFWVFGSLGPDDI